MLTSDTNRNRCTQTPVMQVNPNHTPKLGHSDLCYRSKPPAEQSGHEYASLSQLSLTAHGMLYSWLTLQFWCFLNIQKIAYPSILLTWTYIPSATRMAAKGFIPAKQLKTTDTGLIETPWLNSDKAKCHLLKATKCLQQHIYNNESNIGSYNTSTNTHSLSTRVLRVYTTLPAKIQQHRQWFHSKKMTTTCMSTASEINHSNQSKIHNSHTTAVNFKKSNNVVSIRTFYKINFWTQVSLQ